MKNEICIIIAYFGKFPEYIDLFFKSCAYNKKIDFLVITDQNIKYDSKNIICENMTFEDFKKIVQSNFDFKISFEKPYKICDFRPAFGEIFESYLKKYKYWGHCDVDMILGDIYKFLPSDYENYEKFYYSGHLSIYKNTKKVNSMYKKEYGKDYKMVFTTNKPFIFDEYQGIDEKFRYYKLKRYYSWDYIDISTKKYTMRRAVNCNIGINDNYKYQIFVWEKGHIYRYYLKNNIVCRNEFNYIHFQKRKMNYKSNIKSDTFAIISDGFYEINDKIDCKLIKTINRFPFYRDLNYGIRHIKTRIKNKIKRAKTK